MGMGSSSVLQEFGEVLEFPRGDGLKLAHAVRNRWPPIKIIVTSGQRMAPEDELPEGGRFFAKPYSPAQIRGVLREWAGQSIQP